MLSKKIIAISAAAALFGTSAVAQVAPTAGLLQTVAAEDGTTNTEVLIGVGFALAAFGAILAFSGDSGDGDGDDVPVSP